MTCTVEKCPRPIRCKGLCAMHYRRVLAFGEPGEAEPRNWRALSVEDRFWARVDKTDGCWVWTGGVDTKGYGRMRMNGKKMLTHRIAYMFTHGVELTSSELLLHHCDNPPCCNPAHLYVGTQQDNMNDRTARGRAAAPPYGSRGPNSKLTDDDLHFIRGCYVSGARMDDLAADFGVCRGTISEVVRGTRFLTSGERLPNIARPRGRRPLLAEKGIEHHGSDAT